MAPQWGWPHFFRVRGRSALFGGTPADLPTVGRQLFLPQWDASVDAHSGTPGPNTTVGVGLVVLGDHHGW